MYPAIEQWLSTKVLPGIRQDERVAFVGYLDQTPLVSAVVKKGADAKFCHLHIDSVLRDFHLGEVFFSLMALEVRDLAKTTHFTLPKSVWQDEGQFFRSFGFCEVWSSDKQYRLFDEELHSTAPFSRVWHCAVEKMPKLAQYYAIGGFSPDNQLLLSVHPRYAEDIMKRRKTVELRRKFSTRWLGYRINLYATAPVMSLIGEARISGVAVETPERIWNRFQAEIGCTRPEFDAYVKGAEEIYAIELDDIRPYKSRIPIVQAAQMLGENLVPPQSFLTLEKNRAWAKAISLAAYLHGCLKSTMSLAVDIGQLSPRPVRGLKKLQSTSRLSQSEFMWSQKER
jgi:predicted transcriptional regulator